jgi:transcriptional regulator with XRE-family HTH domain
MRGSTGLPRAELGRRAGVPAGTLRNWEAGRGFPGLPAMLRLAQALGVPVERFAERANDIGEEERPAPEEGLPENALVGSARTCGR